MHGTRDAVLIVDDNWKIADETRQVIKSIGILNVPIAISAHLVFLARDHFPVMYICMAKHIAQDQKHPLKRAVLRHFPTTPVVSYSQGERINPELFLANIRQTLIARDGYKGSK